MARRYPTRDLVRQMANARRVLVPLIPEWSEGIDHTAILSGTSPGRSLTPVEPI